MLVCHRVKGGNSLNIPVSLPAPVQHHHHRNRCSARVSGWYVHSIATIARARVPTRTKSIVTIAWDGLAFALKSSPPAEKNHWKRPYPSRQIVDPLTKRVSDLRYRIKPPFTRGIRPAIGSFTAYTIRDHTFHNLHPACKTSTPRQAERTTRRSRPLALIVRSRAFPSAEIDTLRGYRQALKLEGQSTQID